MNGSEQLPGALNAYDAASNSPTLQAPFATALDKVARGDKNDSGNISPTEKRALAATWKAVVDFSADYKGSSVRDVMGLNNAP